MEKNIREAEARIQESMVLTRIRKIAKIYGGAAFIIGLLIFLFGLASSFLQPLLPELFISQMNTFLMISMGLLIFISGLLQLST